MNSRFSSYLSAFSNRIIIMSNSKNVFRSFLLRSSVPFWCGRGRGSALRPSPREPLTGWDGGVQPTLALVIIRRDLRGHPSEKLIETKAPELGCQGRG